MDFQLSPEAQRFQLEVTAFLDERWNPEIRQSVLKADDQYHLEKDFRLELGRKDWLTISWPQEFGGGSKSLEEQYVFQEAMNYHRARLGIIGVQLVGPTLMAVGSERQKREFLPRIASGEVDMALGYTEPDAGTDLASLQTRAVRDGDDYLITGTKRFTSFANRLEYVWLAARTDPSAPKHRGISLFLVDLRSPGIDIQPLWTMADHRTNEVHFSEVRVPAEALVGEENQGWYYTAYALDLERISLAASPATVRADYDELVAWARASKQGWTANERRRALLTLANHAVELEVVRLLSYRILTMLKSGQVPNAEASMIKIFRSEVSQRLQRDALALLGMSGQLGAAEPRAPRWGRIVSSYLEAVAGTFGAGSNEVMRSTIATRGLGLPRE